MVAQLRYDKQRNLFNLDGLDVAHNRMIMVLIWNEEKQVHF